MPSVATSATDHCPATAARVVVIHACRATVRWAASKPTRAGPSAVRRCTSVDVIGAVDPRQFERGNIALQPLDFGDISEVGQALEAIGGEDDNRRRPGEVGQVKNVRQRRDDERVEMLFGERGANRLMTAFKRFDGARATWMAASHSSRAATVRVARSSGLGSSVPPTGPGVAAASGGAGPTSTAAFAESGEEADLGSACSWDPALAAGSSWDPALAGSSDQRRPRRSWLTCAPLPRGLPEAAWAAAGACASAARAACARASGHRPGLASRARPDAPGRRSSPRDRDHCGRAAARPCIAAAPQPGRRGGGGSRRGRGSPPGFPERSSSTRTSSACASSCLTELDERAPERHARRQVRRMNLEAGPARIDRLLILPGATALLGQLGKRNRRRVLLDPAPQVIDA